MRCVNVPEVFTLVLLLAGVASADGVFLPPLAHVELPAIPTQRAIVVHRDGVERLVVESSLDAEGQSFGWILPVPAVPTSVEASTPGALDTLDLVTGPDVVHTRAGGGRLMIGSLIYLACILLVIRFGFTGRALRGIVLLLLALLIGWLTLVPNLLSARLGGTSIPGVRAGETERVGGYDVTVLSAEGRAALDAWLVASGFAPIPEAGQAAVERYVAEGWRFVAARLAREGDGLAAPHPLAVVFPSEKPVYPMRLTSLAGSSTAVRLHVVADGRAAADGFATTYGETLRSRQSDAPSFSGAKRTIAHPRLVPHLWDGCFLTRLEATLAPGETTEDVTLEIGEASDLVPRVFSTLGAWQSTVRVVGPIWMAVLFGALFLARDRLTDDTGRRFVLTRLIAPITLLAAVAGLITFAALPKVPVRLVGVGEESSGRLRPGSRAEMLLAEEPALAGRETIAARLRERYLELDLRNPFTGEPIREGDSPGDWQLLEDGRGLVVRTFARSGALHDWVIRAREE
jgi:hypothetical protein